MSELKVNKLSPESGTTLTLGDAGDTIVNNGTASGFLPTAGSSGNVLTSDGTNWASTAAAAGAAWSQGALVWNTLSQSLANGVSTALTFNTEIYDTDTIHDTSTNNSRFTIPSGWTKVIIGGQCLFLSNTTGYRRLYVTKNGSGGAPVTGGPSIKQQADQSTHSYVQYNSGPVSCVGTDYFELVAAQTSGGNLNASNGEYSTYFWIWRVA